MGNVYFPNASYYYDKGAKAGCVGGTAPNMPWSDGEEWYSQAGEPGDFVRVEEDRFLYTGDMSELARVQCRNSQPRCHSEAGEVDDALQAGLEPIIKEKMLQWWFENADANAVEQCRSQSGGSDEDAPSVSLDIDEMLMGMMRVEYPDGTTAMLFTLGVVLDDVEDTFVQCGVNTYQLPPAD